MSSGWARREPVYYLVAGRWFSAPDFTGPWTFATPSLPGDFKQIPLEHERSRVLASVPGTDQAVEAILIAQVPNTARVNKKELKAPEVAFQGDPQFTPIETTSVERAVNTDKDVFKVGDLYYMCSQGVWFVGKGSTGPWEVASSVPEEIYKIPVSSPSHHVTYVTVEEDDDSNDDWVVYAAAAGYTGMMVAYGCTMWGSGWYYPPYVGWGGYYPYYYGHFPTYGYSAWYNPYTGAYGRSAGVYGPYGGAGVGARYNPRTGTYARGAAAYGPYGARGVAHAYNPRTGAYAATRQGSNVYGSWGSTAVQRGDDWAKTNRYTNRQTGNTTRTIRTDEGSAVTRRGDQRHGRRRWKRRRVRGERRQRLSAPGRHMAEVRQRRLVEYRQAADWREADAHRSVDRCRTSEHDGSQHAGSTRSRCSRSPRGLTANQRLWQLPQRRRR